MSVRATRRPAGGTRARRSRADVVAAAAAVFARKGYAESTVEDIAQELGILKGSLYHHVRSKEELLYEVVAGPVREMVQALERIVGSAEAADVRLEAFVRMHVDSLARHFPNLSVYLQERFGAERPADEIRLLSKRYQSLVEQLISDGVRAGTFRTDVDPRLAARALLGALNWTHKWMQPGARAEHSAVADTIVAIALQGLAPRQG